MLDGSDHMFDLLVQLHAVLAFSHSSSKPLTDAVVRCCSRGHPQALHLTSLPSLITSLSAYPCLDSAVCLPAASANAPNGSLLFFSPSLQLKSGKAIHMDLCAHKETGVGMCCPASQHKRIGCQPKFKPCTRRTDATVCRGFFFDRNDEDGCILQLTRPEHVSP